MTDLSTTPPAQRTPATSTRSTINPWTWQDVYGYAQGVLVTSGQTLHCAGQAAVDEHGAPLHPGDMEAQAHDALDNLETVLGAAGFTLADLVRLDFYVTDVDAYFAVAASVTERLRAAGCAPASTLLGIDRLAFPSLLIEIQATAVR
jgi:enamine deaminase RidA (YjgF/YER057c/UK114 family)